MGLAARGAHSVTALGAVEVSAPLCLAESTGKDLVDVLVSVALERTK